MRISFEHLDLECSPTHGYGSCRSLRNEFFAIWSCFPDKALITNVCLCNLLKGNSFVCQPRLQVSLLQNSDLLVLLHKAE